MVEITFENIAPVVGLFAIGIATWGAARRFTEVETNIKNNAEKTEHAIKHLEYDLERLQKQVDAVRHDIKDLTSITIKLQQKIEDKMV